MGPPKAQLRQHLPPPHPRLSLTTAAIMTSAPSSDVPQTAATATETPRAPEPMQMDQPQGHQAMDPARPHPETELSLRGGSEGRGMCPGRFCFIIPCPIPCNFCVFPCPF